MTTDRVPRHLARCGDSDAYLPADSLRPLSEAPHLAERLEPGSEVPAGECPGCGAFAYLMDSTPELLDALESAVEALDGLLGITADVMPVGSPRWQRWGDAYDRGKAMLDVLRDGVSSEGPVVPYQRPVVWLNEGEEEGRTADGRIRLVRDYGGGGPAVFVRNEEEG